MDDFRKAYPGSMMTFTWFQMPQPPGALRHRLPQPHGTPSRRWPLFRAIRSRRFPTHPLHEPQGQTRPPVDTSVLPPLGASATNHRLFRPDGTHPPPRTVAALTQPAGNFSSAAKAILLTTREAQQTHIGRQGVFFSIRPWAQHPWQHSWRAWHRYTVWFSASGEDPPDSGFPAALYRRFCRPSVQSGRRPAEPCSWSEFIEQDKVQAFSGWKGSPRCHSRRQPGLRPSFLLPGRCEQPCGGGMPRLGSSDVS